MSDVIDLQQLPFDQFQRYRVAADLVAALGVKAGSSVIDVGGAPGQIEGFLPEHTTVVVDLQGHHDGRFVTASGAALPFADRTFACAICLDTLEHVPPPLRARLVSDLCRVSDVVILSAPFRDELVELAEAALGEFIAARFGGFPTLDEHAEHGLPELEDTLAHFAEEGWSATSMPSGYLPRWLIGMLVHHELLATGLESLPALHAFYNKTVSPYDCREPSYRRVIVASRHHDPAILQEAVSSLVTTTEPIGFDTSVRAIASAVTSARLMNVLLSREAFALAEDIARRDQSIADLERAVVDRDAHIAELRLLNERLVEAQSIWTKMAGKASRSWKERTR